MCSMSGLYPKTQGRFFHGFSIISNNLAFPNLSWPHRLRLACSYLSSFILFLPLTDCFKYAGETVVGAPFDVSYLSPKVNILQSSLHRTQAGWILPWKHLRILPPPRLSGQSSFYLHNAQRMGLLKHIMMLRLCLNLLFTLEYESLLDGGSNCTYFPRLCFFFYFLLT